MITLYFIKLSTDNVNSIDVGDPSTLRHKRLGHMTEMGMKILVSNGKIPKLKEVKGYLCKSCVVEK